MGSTLAEVNGAHEVSVTSDTLGLEFFTRDGQFGGFLTWDAADATVTEAARGGDLLLPLIRHAGMAHPLPRRHYRDMAAPAVVFDVNETLSDMLPVADVFADVGAPSHVARVWFAALLRDGFAAAATGGLVPFAELGREGARSRSRSRSVGWAGTSTRRSKWATASFGGLALHPDVVGVRALAEAGVRMVTLSNGAASVAEGCSPELG